MKKSFTVLVILFLSLSNGFAQTKSSAEQLKNDLDFLFKKMEYIHPNLYAYTSKIEIGRELSLIRTEFKDSINSVDFWLMACPIVNNLHHGHTSITPQNSEVKKYISKLQETGFSYFPFSIIILDSNIYIRDIYSDTKNIERGSKIISINGSKASDILSKLINYENGERMEYRLHKVEKRFIWNYPLLYPNSKYEVKYMDNGIEKSKLLNGINEKETDEYFTKAFASAKNNYRFNLIANNTACIEYNACVDYDNFKLFLDSAFTIIKQNKITNLIIDIRKNGGGDSRLNSLLLTYLTNKPFYECSKHLEKITSDIRSANEYYSQFKKDTILERTKYQYFDNKIENPLLFKGNIYVLTGIETFSSGAEAAMLIKDYKLGIIIGQETGGLASGYGDHSDFELPYTKIRVRVSYKWSLRPSGIDDNRGVIPDIILKPSLQDLLSDKELEMDYVLNLIKKNKTLH
jgi:hypothetical protein